MGKKKIHIHTNNKLRNRTRPATWKRILRAITPRRSVFKKSYVQLRRQRKRLANVGTAALILTSTILPLVDFGSAQAANAELSLESDVITQWIPSTGTTHYTLLDEPSSSPVTTDYISTGTAGSGGEIAEFGLESTENVATVTNVKIYIYAYSATNANGGTLDTVSINLRIGGSLQTAATVTPAYSAGGTHVWYNGSFDGSWTQAQLDAAQAYLVHNVAGGNPASKADDDVRVATVYADITYTQTTTFDQSSYRWFENEDSSGGTTFVKAWGGTATDYGFSVVHTSDGGYAVTGRTTSYGDGNDDVFITKYAYDGTLSWSRTWGGPGLDYGYSIIQTSDDGYAVTGYGTSYGSGSADMFIAKFTSDGTLSWSRAWGGSWTDYGYSIIQTSDGGYAVTGETGNYGAGGSDMFIAKFTSDGTLSWSRTWGGTGSDTGQSIIQTSDGGYAVTGETDSYGAGGSDMFIAKYDSSGTLSWSRTWGGTGSDYGYSLVQTSDGGYAVTGYTNSYGAGLSDMFIAKYTTDGTLSWSRTWGGTSSDSGEDLVQTSDGGYAVTGGTNSYGDPVYGDMFLAKYTSDGILSWNRTWTGGTGNDNGRSLVQTSDGGYAVTGNTTNYGAGSQDMFLAKYAPDGTIAGCNTTMCQSPIATEEEDGVDYTSTVEVDGVDYTSVVEVDGVDYTSVVEVDGVDYTSVVEVDGVDYTSINTTIVATPTVDVGASLAALNTAANAPSEGVPFRLRMNLHVNTAQADPSSATFKLQYAARGADNVCDTSFTNETYADLSPSSGPIRFYNNTNAVDGQPLATNVNDPTHSTDDLVRQSYEESNNFTVANAIPAGDDGMWDFALVDYNAPASTTYCFRAVTSTGTVLNSYAVVPQITTASSTLSQASFRAYENAGATGAESFVKAWGGTSTDIGRSLIQTSDGGYAVTGNTYSYGASGGDMFLAKYDSSGTLSWSRTWGGTDYEFGRSLVQTSDGGYAVTGQTASYGAGSYDMFLAKYDSSGTLSWSRTWGGTSGDYGYSLVQTSDGGYAVTGYTDSYGAGRSDMFLAKYDSSGTLSWSRTWGGTGYDYGKSLVQTSDGGYAVSGNADSYVFGNHDMFLAKYDSSGTLSWSKTWGGTGIEYGQSLVQTTDGGYAVTGYTISYGAGSNDMFLAKYDSSGTLSWSRTWGGIGADHGRSLVQTSDGGYAVSGYTDSYGAGSYDVFLAKYTSDGTLSWSRTWGGTGIEYGQSLAQTSDGGYAVTGYTSSYGAGFDDMFLAKYDSYGDIRGCTSTNCTSPAAYTSSPTPTTSSPTDTTSSPTPTTSSPTDTTSSPTPTTTNIFTPTPISYLQNGTALAAMDIRAELLETDMDFRLRIGLLTSGKKYTGTGTFKLQSGVYTGTCDPATTSYTDVSSATSPIAFYDNSFAATGDKIHPDATNPLVTGSRETMQTYIEANTFNNPRQMDINDTGIWDFALKADGAKIGRTYCFRIVESGASLNGGYSQYAEVYIPPTMGNVMRHGKFFNTQGTQQPFAWGRE